MIRINLLPFRAARKKENVRRQLSVFILSVFFTIAALYFINVKLNSQIQHLSTKVENTKKELAKYDKINKEIAAIKKELAILSKKIEVVKKLDTNRKEPVIFLDTMTKMVIPRRMWLTSLEVKEKKIMLEGIALDNKTVADFMTRMEVSNFFDGVNLKTLKQEKTKKKKLNLKKFEITCTR